VLKEIQLFDEKKNIHRFMNVIFINLCPQSKKGLTLRNKRTPPDEKIL
jgi:hypothetical protein